MWTAGTMDNICGQDLPSRQAQGIDVGTTVGPHPSDDVLIGFQGPPVPAQLGLAITSLIEKLRRSGSGPCSGDRAHKQVRILYPNTTDSDRNRFALRLIEDSVYGVNSYIDFLCKLHSKIQSKG